MSAKLSFSVREQNLEKMEKKDFAANGLDAWQYKKDKAQNT
jgi:hypothetical protein